MSAATVVGVRRQDLDHLTSPGEFAWLASSSGEPDVALAFLCPCGCGTLGSVNVNTPDGWEWDGDRNEPTLAPSIHRVPERGGCGWHGFLRRGTWVSV